MSLEYDKLEVGDVVSYEDMANAPRTYIVIAIQGSDFRLRNVQDFVIKFSNCRGAGWELVTK